MRTFVGRGGKYRGKTGFFAFSQGRFPGDCLSGGSGRFGGSQFPSQQVILEYSQSKGSEAVELYEESGRHAQDWQKLLIENIMAQNDAGLWVHQKYGYEIPRQNGKGEVLTMRELWGINNGENICHTAHKTSTSHSAFVRLFKLLTDAGYVELGRKKKGHEAPAKSFKATKQYVHIVFQPKRLPFFQNQTERPAFLIRERRTALFFSSIGVKGRRR